MFYSFAMTAPDDSPATIVPQGPPINDTQQRILAAAVVCVRQWGIEKTNLNDIAKQAGVTRPTVYRYFASRDDILSAALMQSAVSLGQRLLARVETFDDPAQRLVEAVHFALTAMPGEPYLGVILQTDLSAFVSHGAMMNEQGWALSTDLIRQILRGVEMSAAELADVTETVIRMVLSLLLMSGPSERDGAELRRYLTRVLVPMAGLRPGA
ncbi:TetR/AcrR family transcriptional regulator [Zavarzinia compransoris]|nr:TetR/AcrR family transcriptional regulator [Zavarzinia compransoris]TDP47029.1 TetR family transcriptional regulator [Zavarzinia compransoris]